MYVITNVICAPIKLNLKSNLIDINWRSLMNVSSNVISVLMKERVKMLSGVMLLLTLM